MTTTNPGPPASDRAIRYLRTLLLERPTFTAAQGLATAEHVETGFAVDHDKIRRLGARECSALIEAAKRLPSERASDAVANRAAERCAVCERTVRRFAGIAVRRDGRWLVYHLGRCAKASHAG
jgi:hypothetical protein